RDRTSDWSNHCGAGCIRSGSRRHREPGDGQGTEDDAKVPSRDEASNLQKRDASAENGRQISRTGRPVLSLAEPAECVGAVVGGCHGYFNAPLVDPFPGSADTNVGVRHLLPGAANADVRLRNLLPGTANSNEHASHQASL